VDRVPESIRAHRKMCRRSSVPFESVSQQLKPDVEPVQFLKRVELHVLRRGPLVHNQVHIVICLSCSAGTYGAVRIDLSF